ncbi:MAG: hypothetical protein N2Z85_03570, partial [Patescibacteria group bacterium]|nr:hypothetical protein [Patescibacteria group bacterium]
MKSLDAGTGNFVSYDGNKISIQRNVFLTLSENVTTKQLNTMNIPYAVLNGKIHIIGTKAYELANIFNSSDLKRPMANGLLNPTEPNALPILQLIIKNLLGEPNEKNEKVIYCVPGKPID